MGPPSSPRGGEGTGESRPASPHRAHLLGGGEIRGDERGGGCDVGEGRRERPGRTEGSGRGGGGGDRRGTGHRRKGSDSGSAPSHTAPPPPRRRDDGRDVSREAGARGGVPRRAIRARAGGRRPDRRGEMRAAFCGTAPPLVGEVPRRPPPSPPARRGGRRRRPRDDPQVPIVDRQGRRASRTLVARSRSRRGARARRCARSSAGGRRAGVTTSSRLAREEDVTEGSASPGPTSPPPRRDRMRQLVVAPGRGQVSGAGHRTPQHSSLGRRREGEERRGGNRTAASTAPEPRRPQGPRTARPSIRCGGSLLPPRRRPDCRLKDRF